MSTKDYRLLDSGNQSRLEQFGPYTLARPCAQAVWKPTLDQKSWDRAHGRFTREPCNQWIASPPLPKTWEIELEGVQCKLMPTDFGHIGLFPEHTLLWKWIGERIDTETSMLNLFAYTGGATLYAALMGAKVCHVDSSKTTVAWARENALLNHVTTIRWIVDDVIEFLHREKKRNRRYDAILLDPPTFGRGSQGEIFQIEKDLELVLDLCFQLLSESARWVVLSCHTPGYTPLVLHHLLRQFLTSGTIEMGEMVIPSPIPLPLGAYARWYV